MFKKLENNRPFLKMAFEGFAGDGKTFTAVQVAIGLHKKIGSKKPIAIFDTEKAAKALTKTFSAAGIEAIVVDDQRSLHALNQAIQACEAGEADILIIDSITHVWEELLSAFMKEKRRTRLQFEDWGVLKPKWKQEFSNPFVNAKIHIIFTGRAGYEYSDEKNAETGKREIFKSGIKMKAETETAFEPDILVLMEKDFDLIGERKTMSRNATVIKDRTAQIDGKTFKNPSYKDFAPAINALLDGTSKDTSSGYMADTFEDPEGRWGKIKAERDKLISEIEGVFNYLKLGTSKEDKGMKSAVLNKLFKVVSVDNLTDIKNEKLSDGLHIMKEWAEAYIKYVDGCFDEQTQPDLKHIGQLLDLEIAKNEDPLG